MVPTPMAKSARDDKNNFTRQIEFHILIYANCPAVECEGLRQLWTFYQLEVRIESDVGSSNRRQTPR